MPTGPKGQKRPADVIGTAVRVMHIATSEVEEGAPVEDGKDPAAVAMGKKGGAARAKALDPGRRADIEKKQLNLDGKRSLFALKKSSFCSIIYHLRFNTAYDNVRLHHWIGKPECLLFISSPFDEYIAAVSCRKPL